ncbi:MAG: GNAT family N-acetyltransferase [Chloroflexi bacterium]|nr:GNAT family N-acetyltransferase [Chloroflexota bacterium]
MGAPGPAGRRVRVRFAVPADAPAIVSFVRGLAAFEREPPESVRLTESDLRRDLFGATPRAEVLIAEQRGRAVGFALFFANYSTWEGRPGLYIEDLFVEEAARSQGVGRALMAAVARLARERGCARVELSVLDWNPARAFYERLGMRWMREWLPYRLDGAALDALAAEGEQA